MGWKVTSAPASEPISRSEMKTWLKVESGVTEDDDLIDALITAGRKWVERQTGLALVTQTITEYWDCWPLETRLNPFATIDLSVSPVQSVTSVKYKAQSDGTLTTWSSSNYNVDTSAEYSRARIAPSYDLDWPEIYDEINAIEVVYVAGWSATTDAGFPQELLTAVKYWVAGAYDNRADYAKRYKNMSEAIVSSVAIRQI